jgi:hypothetical protein
MASVMLIRREITMEDWSTPEAAQYGIKATTQFSKAIVRSNEATKIANKE